MGPGPIRENAALAKPRRRRRWLITLGILLGVLSIVFFMRNRLLCGAGALLDVSQTPGPCDAAVAMGEGETAPLLVAALVRTKLAKQTLAFKGSDAGIARAFLRSRELTDAQITDLDAAAAGVRAQAQALASYLETHPAQTVTVVATNFQTRRVRMILRQELGDRMRQVRIVGAPTDGFDATNWWRYEIGFTAYPTEYLKIVFAWFGD